MMEIHFSNDHLFNFAIIFLQSPRMGIEITINHASRTLMIDNHVIGLCLRRLSQGESTILPYRTKESDSWIIVATSRSVLEQIRQRISYWIMPSYGELIGNASMAHLKHFDATQNALQAAGARIFTAGYYSFNSLKTDFASILKNLRLWLVMEEQRPQLVRDQQPVYAELAALFDSALATQQWTLAEQTLREMRRRGLSSAENLLFLEIQFFNQQRNWTALWNHPEFVHIAKIKIPRMVRAAMLTAFHQTQLISLESEGLWDEAITRFKELKPRLGQLLTGRFDIKRDSVLIVFAYQALLDNDEQTLRILQSEGGDSIQSCIQAMYDRIQPQSVLNVGTINPLEYYTNALRDYNYDAALTAITMIPDRALQAQYTVEIAFLSGDDLTINHALQTWWSLPPIEQQTIFTQAPIIQRWVYELESLINQDTTLEKGVANWTEWFEAFHNEPTAPYLSTSLTSFVAKIESESASDQEIIQLTEGLIGITTVIHSLSKDQINQIVIAILKTERFPCDEAVYQELYEAIYVYLLDQKPTSATQFHALLRFVDALLQKSPTRVMEFLSQLQNLFRIPIPILEEVVLEVFDLFADYGISGQALIQWYRDWITALLNLPTARSMHYLHLWRSFGQWIQPGADILRQLDAVIHETTLHDETTALMRLSAGYRIGIFTLRKSSAERAKQLLLEQNEGLDIRICTEKDLSPQVQALAQNSDVVLIVTSCITHALTYGIAPYLEDERRIYVNGGGSSSLIQALEHYLQA